MGIIEVLLTSIGLAMDAFAVSICKGLAFSKVNLKNVFMVSLYFGIFQGLMPLIGYVLGSRFKDLIISVDHWIAFFLLALIGLSMLKEGFSKEYDSLDDKVNLKVMLPLAIATSIDALAVGITFAFLKVNIISSVLIISVITIFICFIGVLIGNKVGIKYQKKAQVVGGFILIVIGLKILLEHLGFLLLSFYK